MRRLTGLACAAAAAMLAFGCADQNAEVDRRELELRSLDLSAPAFKELRGITLVDVHTHTFNARYLPLENIASGKRDKSFWTALLPDFLARAIAASIVARAELAPIGAETFLAAEAPETPEDAVIRVAAEEGRSVEEITSNPEFQQVQSLLNGKGPLDMDRVLVWSEAQRPSGLASFAPYHDPGFLRLLTLPDGPREELYRAIFGVGPRRVLRLTHMMDLGPVFGQVADGRRLLTMEDQVRRMEHFQSASKGTAIYFVPYCPFRDNAKPGEALRLVKDAVEHHHAYGVKIYPPSGYRPIENQIPPRPGNGESKYAREQWDARYQDVTGGELDRRLAEVLEYCRVKDLPVFVHCNYNELEPRKGYGKLMADPRWWEKYLEQEGRGTLRLCFGHSGGPDAWFGEGKLASWGETVIRLCRKYPNVYCEMGIEEEAANPRARAWFVNSLVKRFAEPAGKELPYRLSDKVMYGTDWFMPVDCDRRDYLAGYERAFLHAELRPYYRGFFRDNALAYLNAKGRLQDPSMDPSVRSTLEAVLLEP